MLQFQGLHIENFLSHGFTGVDFQEGELTLVLGENLDSTHSSSNGAGKSTIFEALFWCLYGKSTRGSRGGEVVSRVKNEEDNCLVTVQFSYLGNIYIVKRGRVRNKPFFATVMDGKPVNDFDFPISPELFLTTVYFPQERLTSFAGSADSYRKKILREIHDLGRFEKYQTTAKDLVSKISIKMNEAEQTVHRLDGRIEVAEEQLEENRIALLESVQNIQDEYNLAKKILLQRRIKLGHKRTPLENAVEDLGEHVDSSARDALRVKYEAFAEKSKVMEAELANGEKRLSQLKAECPLCAQEITDEYREILRMELPTEEVSKRKEKQDRILKQISVLEGKYFMTQGAVEEAEQELADMENEIVEINKEMKVEQDKFSAVLAKVKETEESIKILEESLEADKKERSIIFARVSKLQTQENLAEFWVEHFGNKGIISFLLDQSLPHLNVIARHKLSYLYPELALSFDTKRFNTSGNSVEDFSIFIDEDDRRYFSLSGGEKKRVDLAILLALATYARQLFPINLLFLDEIFAGLDEIGCDGVLELLQMEREESDVNTFVVSHQDDLKDSELWDRVLLVRKENGVSEILEKS